MHFQRSISFHRSTLTTNETFILNALDKVYIKVELYAPKGGVIIKRPF